MNLTKVHGVWKASFRTAAGKRKTVSTRCTDKDEAVRVVKDSGLKDLEMAAKSGRLTREAIGHITAGKKLTIAKAIDEFETSSLKRLAPKTVHNSVGDLRAWAKAMKIEHLPPSSIQEEHIDAWINDPKSELKGQTRRVHLSTIRSLFAFCSDRGWCAGNPAGRSRISVNFDILSHDQKEAKVRQPFTKAEVNKLLDYCRENGLQFWEFAIRCSSETGLRLGDIARLEWSCFQKPKLLTVWTGKTNKRLEDLPISDAIAKLSTEIPVTHDKYLFPEQQEIITDVARRATLSTQFTRLCAKVGIEDRSFHSLRHHVATEQFGKADKETLARKLAETLSIKEISALLGHSNAKTTRRYIH